MTAETGCGRVGAGGWGARWGIMEWGRNMEWGCWRIFSKRCAVATWVRSASLYQQQQQSPDGWVMAKIFQKYRSTVWEVTVMSRRRDCALRKTAFYSSLCLTVAGLEFKIFYPRLQQSSLACWLLAVTSLGEMSGKKSVRAEQSLDYSPHFCGVTSDRNTLLNTHKIYYKK